jgi:ATP-dependent DNA ligase
MCPTLYKYDTTGKPRFWDVEVDPFNGRYRFLTGVVGSTNVVASEWTQAKPKNEGRANATTAVEQAFKEAEAAWTKKKKEGYHEDISKSGASFFEPMLAKTFSPKRIDSLPLVFVQPKLDGMRCIATKDGLFSRNGEKIVAVDHIWLELAPIFAASPATVLDGELYTHTLSDQFQRLMSICRKQDPTDEQIREARIMEYHVYDGVFEGSESRTGFHGRFMRLLDTLDEFSLVYGVPVSTRRVDNPTEDVLWGMHDQYVSEGYEGMMVRTDAPYQIGKRSPHLLKMKRFDDDEFEILGVLPGEGNWSGVAKTLHCRTEDGEDFFPTIKAPREVCDTILRNASNYIGKQATVRYQGLTDAGKPRFPIAKALHMENRW